MQDRILQYLSTHKIKTDTLKNSQVVSEWGVVCVYREGGGGWKSYLHVNLALMISIHDHNYTTNLTIIQYVGQISDISYVACEF